ncbi:zinc finger protein 36, C3H1 type-like 2-A [Austrofundulus limnaeus]|uniref:mRNA decay activator protein ZFP36 n=1 Tax=Austrofundulus limnaeus TaxID=52670 RepID=A0A2I4DBL9_AUSLI|nr:PREDICTED: zinc finger protein 36, C3H1 type-like 2 [Austrofundulus limnaeus]
MSAALLDLDLDLDLDLFYMNKSLDMNRLHYNSLVDQKAVRSPVSAPGPVSLSPVSAPGPVSLSPVSAPGPVSLSPVSAPGPVSLSPVSAPGPVSLSPVSAPGPVSLSPVSAPGPVSLSAGVFHRKWSGNLEALTRLSLDFCSTENHDPSSLMNKENRFQDRVYSETGDRRVLPQKSGSQVNSTRYKTELCRPFEESGSCKYGDKCQFAHGYQELRTLSRHPKYKTEPCRTFHTIGFCPYGPRCHFIHNAEERRPAPLTNANLQGVQKVEQTPYSQRPKLRHSFSFSSFSRHSGLDCPLSRTPTPPSFCNQLLSPGSEVLSPGTSLSVPTPLARCNSCTNPPPVFYGTCPPSPQTYRRHLETLRGLSRSPVSEPPPSPPDSLSDRDSYGSCSSSGSLSGSESPSLDPGKRLPIFSRLSISED